jgi:hypothetical protein
MVIFFDAPVSPDALTTFVRQVPLEATLRLLEDFPIETTEDNTIDFAEIVKRNRVAKYRTLDGSIHVSARDSGSTKRVKLMPLSDSLNESEYERLQRLYAKVGGTFTEAMEQAIYNDAETLTRYMQNRLELAWGDVLGNAGVLTINENGVKGFEADYGVPANQKVAATVVWSDLAQAKVITDIVAWNDIYRKNNGVSAQQIRTSQRVIRLMTRNKEVIDNIYGAADQRTRVKLSELNDYLSEEGLPTIVEAYDGQLDVDGVDTRVIAEDKVLFTPANLRDLGYTAWGITATALELVESNQSEYSFREAPGIVGVVEKVGPPYRKFTFVDGMALPVLSDAKKLLVADVL